MLNTRWPKISSEFVAATLVAVLGWALPMTWWLHGLLAIIAFLLAAHLLRQLPMNRFLRPLLMVTVGLLLAVLILPTSYREYVVAHSALSGNVAVGPAVRKAMESVSNLPLQENIKSSDQSNIERCHGTMMGNMTLQGPVTNSAMKGIDLDGSCGDSLNRVQINNFSGGAITARQSQDLQLNDVRIDAGKPIAKSPKPKS